MCIQNTLNVALNAPETSSSSASLSSLVEQPIFHKTHNTFLFIVHNDIADGGGDENGKSTRNAPYFTSYIRNERNVCGRNVANKSCVVFDQNGPRRIQYTSDFTNGIAISRHRHRQYRQPSTASATFCHQCAACCLYPILSYIDVSITWIDTSLRRNVFTVFHLLPRRAFFSLIFFFFEIFHFIIIDVYLEAVAHIKPSY